MPDPKYPSLEALTDDIFPQKFLLDQDVCTIGRDESCNLIYPDKIVSRVHAKIEKNGPRYYLHDTSSTNGTFVNGQRIQEPHLLRDNNQIGIGMETPALTFRDVNVTVSLNRYGELEYWEQRETFAIDGQGLTELTRHEFLLLKHLYTHAGELCSHEGCEAAVWPADVTGYRDPGSLHQLVARLRTKLKAANNDVDPIKNIRGRGYMLD